MAKDEIHLVEDDTKPGAVEEAKAPDAPQETSAASPTAQQQAAVLMEPAKPLHCNFCRVTALPEEFLFDYFMHPNIFGGVLAEKIEMQARIVMSPEAAKRTAANLLETVRLFEEKFGEIKADPRRRLQEEVL